MARVDQGKELTAIMVTPSHLFEMLYYNQDAFRDQTMYITLLRECVSVYFIFKIYSIFCLLTGLSCYYRHVARVSSHKKVKDSTQTVSRGG